MRCHVPDAAARALELARTRLGTKKATAASLRVDRAVIHRVRTGAKAGLSEGSYVRIRTALTDDERALWDSAFEDPFFKDLQLGFRRALPPGTEMGSREREQMLTVWSRLPKLLGMEGWQKLQTKFKRLGRAAQEMGANSGLSAGILGGSAMVNILRPLGMGEAVGVTRSLEKLNEDGSLKRYLMGAAKAYVRIIGPEPRSTPRQK